MQENVVNINNAIDTYTIYRIEDDSKLHRMPAWEKSYQLSSVKYRLYVHQSLVVLVQLQRDIR